MLVIEGVGVSTAQTPQVKGELLLSGDVEVKDGDTITINKVRVRLSGIDAAEGRQRCAKKGGGSWDCAGEATAKLKQIIEKGKGELRCTQVDTDTKNNRPVARCWVGTLDIQRELVKAGLVWAYREFENCYEADENEAKNNQEGIWQAETMPPWDWRSYQSWLKRKVGALVGWTPRSRPESQVCRP